MDIDTFTERLAEDGIDYDHADSETIFDWFRKKRIRIELIDDGDRWNAPVALVARHPHYDNPLVVPANELGADVELIDQIVTHWL